MAPGDERATATELIIETNEWDVFLGRGKKTNYRAGNMYFRQLANENTLEYGRCGSAGRKDEIAKSVISHIRSKGGRFVRPVAATNAQGTVVSAFEIVSEDVVLAKTKQALRDAAMSRKEKKKVATLERQHDHNTTARGPSPGNTGQVPDGPLSSQLPFMDVGTQLLQRQLLLDSLALPNNPVAALHSASATMPPAGRPSFGNSDQIPDQHLRALMDTDHQRRLLLDSLTLSSNPMASHQSQSATKRPKQSHNPPGQSSEHSSQIPRQLPPMGIDPRLLQRRSLLDSFAGSNHPMASHPLSTTMPHYPALNPVGHSARFLNTSIPTHDMNSMIMQQLRQKEIANLQLQMMGEGISDPNLPFPGTSAQLRGQMELQEGSSRKRRAPTDRLVEEMARKPSEITRSSSLLQPSRSLPIVSNRRASLPTHTSLDQKGIDLSQWATTRYGFPQKMPHRTSPREEQEQSAFARLPGALRDDMTPSISKQSKTEVVGNKASDDESNESSATEASMPFADEEEQGE